MTNNLAAFDDQLLDGLHFCKKAYDLFEDIRSDGGGKSKLRMRASGVEKKLLEEILPICKYIQTKYRSGRYISVRWMAGNQQYDAEIHQVGAYIEEGYLPGHAFLEVTCAMHPNDYLSRELLDKQGVAFGVEGIKRRKDHSIESTPVVHSNQDFVARFVQQILNRISDKVGKLYPTNTSLIVSCHLDTLYMPDEWESLREQLIKAKPAHSFREIFIYDTTCEYTFSLWPAQ